MATTENLEDPLLEETSESVDELRQRLNRMKKTMADRNQNFTNPPQRNRGPDVINGQFLSIMFGIALVVIVSVSVYTFYNLIVAIMKRNIRFREEL